MTRLLWGIAVAMLVTAAAVPLAQQPATADVKFNAASIKPVPADAAQPRSAGTMYQGNRFSATNASLMMLLRSAYGAQRYLVSEQFEGGPEWLERERFDIIAVAAGTPTREDFQAMERALLAERFALRVREAVRELPVFSLELARDDRRLGRALRPVTVDCAAAKAASAAAHPAPPEPPTPSSLLTRTASPCDTLTVGSGLTTRFSGRAIDIETLAQHVTVGLKRPTLDRTELEGQFDVDLEYLNTSIERGVQPPTINGQPVDAPTLTEALREQLGLKIERDRGFVPVLVIEHVQRPQPD
jgi:uncharacterized protein (TIGR03435 family)